MSSFADLQRSEDTGTAGEPLGLRIWRLTQPASLLVAINLRQTLITLSRIVETKTCSGMQTTGRAFAHLVTVRRRPEASNGEYE